jgi:hypothetical protein
MQVAATMPDMVFNPLAEGEGDPRVIVPARQPLRR